MTSRRFSSRTGRAIGFQKAAKLSVKFGRQRAEKRDCTIKDPTVENETVQWYSDNPCLWDMKHADFKNKQIRQTLLMTKAAEIGLKDCDDLKTWFTSLRDQCTRLKKRQNDDELPDFTAREQWVLDKFSFFKQRKMHQSMPIKSLNKQETECNMELGGAAPRGVMLIDDNGNQITDSPASASTGSWLQIPGPSQATDDSTFQLYLQQTPSESTDIVKRMGPQLASPKKDLVRSGFAHYVKCVLLDLSASDFRKARKQITGIMDQFLDKSEDEEEELPTRKRQRSRSADGVIDDDLIPFPNRPQNPSPQTETWQSQHWHSNPPTSAVRESQNPNSSTLTATGQLETVSEEGTDNPTELIIKEEKDLDDS